MNRGDLYAYQRHAVDFIKARRNCALWVDMGLGKTVSTLTAFADLRDSLDARRVLVIAPKRVARKVWSDEVAAWSHLRGLSVSRIVGDTDSCFQALRTLADVSTIGRDRCAWLHAQFVRDGKQVVEWPWDVVVLDEAQSFASQSSQRWKAIADLRLKSRFPRMIQLSGTPMPNGYMKLWSQFRLLDNGKRLGKYENAMKERWFTPPIGMFTKWTLKPSAEREIQARLKDIVLTLREEDYLDLPPVKDNFIRCELSPAAMSTYRRMEREYITEVAGKKLTAVNAGVLDGKLLQLANGAVYHEGKNWVPFHDAKLEALEETLEGIAGKALICYGFNHDKARISLLLDKAAARDGRIWRLLDSDRDFSDWAAGRIDWGLLHPASAGHGLNDVYKAGAEDLVFFGLTNNLELYEQARARVTGGHRRVGRAIKIHHIVADGTRDDDYVRLIQKKALDQDNLMAALAVKLGHRTAA
ncbi:MAG TPA: DEAD/DEAH box helicase [Stellaceae bacterium]|nr:DEAD/DEAH box helicase [Terriglobia bacterium]HEV2551772.1 DEAD/DEAH box helicase [Stellaceae bacterium]